MCYYFDDIVKLEDFDFNNILIDEKSHILIDGISCKTLISPKPLRNKFDKIDGFIRICDWTRYLTLFVSEKYEVSKMVLHIFFLTILRKPKLILMVLYLLKKILTLHVIILVKSVLNKR